MMGVEIPKVSISQPDTRAQPTIALSAPWSSPSARACCERWVARSVGWWLDESPPLPSSPHALAEVEHRAVELLREAVRGGRLLDTPHGWRFSDLHLMVRCLFPPVWVEVFSHCGADVSAVIERVNAEVAQPARAASEIVTPSEQEAVMREGLRLVQGWAADGSLVMDGDRWVFVGERG